MIVSVTVKSLQSYLGEEYAELRSQVGRDSRGNTTSSGKDESRGVVTIVGRDIADTWPLELLVSLRCALISYQVLYVSCGFVANGCNGKEIKMRV